MILTNVITGSMKVAFYMIQNALRYVQTIEATHHIRRSKPTT